MAEIDYSSRGQGNLNTVLGAIGTAGAIVNGGGLLNSLFGNKTTTSATNDDHTVDRYELNTLLTKQAELQAKDLEIANLNTDIKLRDANTYTDTKLIDVYKQAHSEIAAMETAYQTKIAALEAQLSAQAVLNQANKDSFSLLMERMNCCKSDLSDAISREAQTRSANDNLIVTYANSTFYPKQVASVTTGTTTTPQDTYNPLPINNL